MRTRCGSSHNNTTGNNLNLKAVTSLDVRLKRSPYPGSVRAFWLRNATRAGLFKVVQFLISKSTRNELYIKQQLLIFTNQKYNQIILPPTQLVQVKVRYKTKLEPPLTLQSAACNCEQTVTPCIHLCYIYRPVINKSILLR